MQIKTFRAGSMHAALQLVRQSLGPDAAVLQTREVNAGVLQWLRGQRQVEVVASADVAVPSRLPATPADGSRTTPDSAGILPGCEAATPPPAITTLQEDFRDRFLRAAADDRGDVPSLVEGLAGSSADPFANQLPPALRRAYRELRELELGDAIAREIAASVRRTIPRDRQEVAAVVRAQMLETVEQMLRVQGAIRVIPGSRRVVALVGPTGVGKTTCIAKLAASFRLQRSFHVGLVTLDTRRVAAVEQLRAYAEILELPIEVASTRDQLRRSLDRLADADLVLVDTAGLSSGDRSGLQGLHALLADTTVDDVQLVLSLVSSRSCMTQAATAFAATGATSLLLTKLDEATRPGDLLGLQRACGLPISYVTDGQKVPDDIRPADPRELSRRILGNAFSASPMLDPWEAIPSL